MTDGFSQHDDSDGQNCKRDGETEDPSARRQAFVERIQLMAGLVLVCVSAVLMVYTFYFVFQNGVRDPFVGMDHAGANWADILRLVSANFQIVAAFLLSALSGYLGLRLFSSINANNSQVIKREDRRLLEPLISSANRDAIDQYIRLTSLSGAVGAFTKVGFTGLPLATVSLTLIFTACALLTRGSEKDIGVTATTLFDMAKLTLGAFIGSFVQRQVEQRQITAPSGEQKIITSEKLPV